MFKVGDEIICIDRFECDNLYFYPGEEYIVSNTWDTGFGVRLPEGKEGGWSRATSETRRYWSLYKVHQKYFRLKQKFYIDL